MTKKKHPLDKIKLKYEDPYPKKPLVDLRHSGESKTSKRFKALKARTSSFIHEIKLALEELLKKAL